MAKIMTSSPSSQMIKIYKKLTAQQRAKMRYFALLKGTKIRSEVEKFLPENQLNGYDYYMRLVWFLYQTVSTQSYYELERAQALMYKQMLLDMTDGSPIYCLLCHRVIDYAFLKNRAYDSTLVHPVDGRFRESHAEFYDAVKSHMICHFFLGDTPKPNRMHIGFYGPDKKHYRGVPQSWLSDKPHGLEKIQERFDWKAPLPLTRERKPTHDSVEKHYLSLL